MKGIFTMTSGGAEASCILTACCWLLEKTLSMLQWADSESSVTLHDLNRGVNLYLERNQGYIN